MNKRQLANKIWESANKMRAKIDANAYKVYILGLIFYKFLSANEVQYLKKNGATPEDIKKELARQDLRSNLRDSESVASLVRENCGYVIAYENLFSTWLEKGTDFSVADVRDALVVFDESIDPKSAHVFREIFKSLENGLGDLAKQETEQTKVIRDLLYLIDEIPMDGKQGYDVLGFVYEYLIGKFAANAGKKAGEFYTPHEVSVLMSQIVAESLKGRKTIKIYDPTSGSGSLLINIGQAVERNAGNAKGVKYFAQELKTNTYNLTRMNLTMRGIAPGDVELRNADTLEDDWPIDLQNSAAPLRVDAVVSNPPYSQSWNRDGAENDPRFDFGLAPNKKAEYAFLLHDLYHLNDGGIITIVLPHGVLFRGDDEYKIRRRLIDGNYVDAIIGLPPNIFFGTSISTIIMILKKVRDERDVLIIDASKGFEKEGKNNKLRACDIQQIADAVAKREEVPKFSRRVPFDEIRANDYNLNIPRYVDSSDDAETWDIYASMFGGVPNAELDRLDEYWRALPGLREALFASDETPYSRVAVEDVKETLRAFPGVLEFEKRFQERFATFGDYLARELVDRFDAVPVAREIAILADEIFRRLDGVPLVDKYDAYQLLADEWTQISTDLETLQAEGIDATRAVDPNLVEKKKDGKDVIVQEGWVGRVLPFDLVQRTFLTQESETLAQKEARVAEITEEYAEIFDMLTEDDKSYDLLNDDESAIDKKKAAALFKELVPQPKGRGKKNVQKTLFSEPEPDEDSLEGKLARFLKLVSEEKALNKQIKGEKEALHLKTKATIETLTDEQALELLRKKWIAPLLEKLNATPGVILNELGGKIRALVEKYDDTLVDIDRKIHETENDLANMLDDLVGNEFDEKGLAEFKKLLKGE